MKSPAIKLAAIETRIQTIHGASVLFDNDLVELYGVPPNALMPTVRRNVERLPSDFMFQLANHEVMRLKSQTVISSFQPRHSGRPADEVIADIKRRL
jgi:ORF6N domain